jgi:hypothetical protein
MKICLSRGEPRPTRLYSHAWCLEIRIQSGPRTITTWSYSCTLPATLYVPRKATSSAGLHRVVPPVEPRPARVFGQGMEGVKRARPQCGTISYTQEAWQFSNTRSTHKGYTNLDYTTLHTQSICRRVDIGIKIGQNRAFSMICTRKRQSFDTCRICTSNNCHNICWIV